MNVSHLNGYTVFYQSRVQVGVGQLELRVPLCDGFAETGQLELEGLDDPLWAGLHEAFLRVRSQRYLRKRATLESNMKHLLHEHQAHLHGM